MNVDDLSILLFLKPLPPLAMAYSCIIIIYLLEKRLCCEIPSRSRSLPSRRFCSLDAAPRSQLLIQHPLRDELALAVLERGTTATPTTNTNCTSTPQMYSPFMVGSVVLETPRKQLVNAPLSMEPPPSRIENKVASLQMSVDPTCLMHYANIITRQGAYDDGPGARLKL